MPEMPEVETVRHDLEAAVRGARIEAAQVLWPPFVDAAAGVLDTEVVGHRIDAVRRRGKQLIVDLDDGWHLMIHLKMTGQVVVQRNGRTVALGGHPSANLLGPMPNDWTRAVFVLSGGRTLFVNDPRKFGRIRAVTTAALQRDRFLADMGPEPLDPGFTLAVLKAQLEHHRAAPIKAALLDQSTIAGIGNIYADECLHLARVHPRQPTATLTPQQLRRLHRAIRSVLRAAVSHGGTSFAHYINEARAHDSYLAHARVFGRANKPCRVCGTPIERIRVAGRGTNYCPRCQPEVAAAAGA